MGVKGKASLVEDLLIMFSGLKKIPSVCCAVDKRLIRAVEMYLNFEFYQSVYKISPHKRTTSKRFAPLCDALGDQAHSELNGMERFCEVAW